MVTVLHTCDNLVNWSFFSCVGSNPADADHKEGVDCVLLDANPAQWYIYGYCNHADVDATTEPLLKFWFKAGKLGDAVKHRVTVHAPDAANTFFYDSDFEDQLTLNTWEAVTLDLRSPQGTLGAPDIADVREIRWRLRDVVQDKLYRVDYIRIESAAPPPVTGAGIGTGGSVMAMASMMNQFLNLKEKKRRKLIAIMVKTMAKRKTMKGRASVYLRYQDKLRQLD